MIYFLCFIFLYGRVNSLQCEQASNIEKKDPLSSFIIKGNYTIKVISTFTFLDSNCTRVSLEGLVTYYAIKHAIETANNNPKLGTVGIHFEDNCGKLSATMAKGIEVISSIKMEKDCHETYMQCSASESFVQSPAAILGTDMSSTTIPLANLMSLYQVPIISPSASSRLLSDPKMYRSFVRVVPSDSMQVQAILSILKNFTWTTVFAVGSNDPYGKLALADLEIEAKSMNICISTSYVSYPAEKFNAEVNSTIKNIKSSNATVVVMFCYFAKLGEFILERAHEENINRTWLTSDAWNIEAQNKTYKHDVPISQMHGLLSVSFKYRTIPKLIDYIKNEISTNYLYDFWLHNYLIHNFCCKPNKISIDKSTFVGNNCSVSVDEVMSKLSESEVTSNWVDAVTVLAHGIQNYSKDCMNNTCLNTAINYTRLNEIIKKNYWQLNGNLVFFNKLNDPIPAYYTIDNLQYDETNGTLNYINVGNWTNTNNDKKNFIFNIESDNIKWPKWVQNNSKPRSKCQQECEKNSLTKMKPNSCCWTCERCKGPYKYVNSTTDTECQNCSEGEHTEDNIKCTKTNIIWLKYNDSEGIAVVVFSSIGLVLIIISGAYLFKFRFLLKEDRPFLQALSISLPFFSFLFGYMNIFEPTDVLCSSKNVVFFLLLMTYSSVLLIKTKLVAEYLNKKAIDKFKCRLLTIQIASIVILLLVEMIPVFILIFLNQQSDHIPEEPKKYFIRRICTASFKVPSLISNFIPLIILILATCCAFRERNLEHHFYEPKFVNFTCIALLVVMIAYLLTFNFVKEELKSIVMTFTICIFAIIYSVCLILPKIYVGHVRNSETTFKIKRSSKNNLTPVSPSMYQQNCKRFTMKMVG